MNELDATTTGADRLHRGSLLVIFLTVFIDLLGFGIVLPLLPLYAVQFSVDSGGWLIGLLMASFSIMQFLFAPVWGSLSDRFGRRPILLIGLAGSVLFYSLFGWATIQASLTGLFVARIGAGIAGATIPTAQAYIADTTSRENRARGMALIGMAFGLGFTIGPLFAWFAIGNSDSGTPGPGPGFVAAGLSAIAFLMALFLLPESHTPGKRAPHTRRQWIDLSAWRSAFARPAIAFLLGGFALCIFSFSNFETTLSLLLKGPGDAQSVADSPFQFTFRQVCLVFAGIGLLVAFVQGGVVRPLARVISEKHLAVAGALIEVAGFAGVAFAVRAASFNGLIAALIVVVAGYACLQPSIFSLLSRWSDPQQQGAVLGVGQSVSALARIFGSALGIPLLMISFPLPYIVGSACMVIVALLILRACHFGRDFGTVGDVETGSADQAG